MSIIKSVLNVRRTRGRNMWRTFPGRARSSVITDANLTPWDRVHDAPFVCTRRKYDFHRAYWYPSIEIVCLYVSRARLGKISTSYRSVLHGWFSQLPLHNSLPANRHQLHLDTVRGELIRNGIATWMKLCARVRDTYSRLTCFWWKNRDLWLLPLNTEEMFGERPPI